MVSAFVLLHHHAPYETKKSCSLEKRSKPTGIWSGYTLSCSCHAPKAARKPLASARFSSSVRAPSTCNTLPLGPDALNLLYWSTKHCDLCANCRIVYSSHQSVKLPLGPKYLPIKSKAMLVRPNRTGKSAGLDYREIFRGPLPRQKHHR